MSNNVFHISSGESLLTDANAENAPQFSSQNYEAFNDFFSDRGHISDNEVMTTSVSRDEINAKFDAINANMQAHEARIDSRIQKMESLLERSIEESRQSRDASERAIAAAAAAVTKSEELNTDTVKHVRSTALASIIATVLGTAALVGGIYAITNSWQQSALSNNNSWIQRELSEIQDSLKDIKQAQGQAPLHAPPAAAQAPTKH